MSTGENEGKGQETGLSRDIGASRLPRAGETGQDPLRTEARRAEGVDGGGHRPGSCGTGPLCPSLRSSVSYPSLIDGNRLMTDLWSKWSPLRPNRKDVGPNALGQVWTFAVKG